MPFWLLLGGGGVGGAALMFLFNMWVVEPIKVSAAVKVATASERAKQEQICAAAISANAETINAANDKILDEAMDARESLGRTPIDQAELQDLCNAEPACRDRVAADPKKVTR